jgi:beta-mannosidase
VAEGAGSVELDGSWSLVWSDGQRGLKPEPIAEDADLSGAIEALVPGEVHLDLLRAGHIPGPYVGTGALASRWVEEYVWYYHRDFEAPEHADRAWLVFEELDLVARVFVNGELAGTHANSFRPCRLDVTELLRPGSNRLVVEIESGLFSVSDKAGKGYGMYRDVLLHKRHWLRKPQSQFTWDWSTRLVNVGISGPVRLEWTTKPVRLDRVVALAETDADLRHARVTVRAFLDGLGETAVSCRIEATLDGGSAVAAEVVVRPGLHAYEVELSVDDPELWWPIGCGAQPLSDVVVTVTYEGAVVGTSSRRVGFRHVKIAQPEDPAGGRRFVVEVNCRPVFCKGANLVPADMIFQRADAERYRVLVDRAVEANFNFLRVWGGGLYESDDLFDECDRRGILVWQEFIYACARYPTTDPAYLQDVKLEAEHQVRRLAHHPSLVIWCGNNENEWGTWDWGFDRDVAFPDHALYHVVLPRIMAAEDPTRFYQPSSPWSPDGSHPNADDIGDQHPWSIAFANTDFREYREMACRFPNEGGILGPTALPTMLECLEGGPPEVGSFAWRLHDNVNAAHADAMLEQWVGLKASELSVEEYTYWAGLVQGEGLREYIDNFRRRMYDTSSAIFWMYNDCWPATRSWTIVDYRLRRTPAFNPVRRAMAPVSVVLTVEGDNVCLYGVNDTDEAVNGTVRFGLLDITTSEYPVDRTVPAELAPNGSTLLVEFARTAWTEPTTTIALAQFTDVSGAVTRGRLILPLFKEMAWPDAALKVRVEDDHAVFESDVFVWGVCLDLDGDEPLEDNFFDVWPGVPHRVAWRGSEPPVVLHLGNNLETPGMRRTAST